MTRDVVKNSIWFFVCAFMFAVNVAFAGEDRPLTVATTDYVGGGVDYVKNDLIGFEDVNGEDTLVVFSEPGNDNYLGVTRVVDGLREVMGIAKASEVAIGNTGDLTTSDTSSLVAAINEVAANSGGVGDLENLTTSDQSSLVAAINEVVSELDDTANKLGDVSQLTVVDANGSGYNNVVGAVNRINEYGIFIYNDYEDPTDFQFVTLADIRNTYDASLAE